MGLLWKKALMILMMTFKCSNFINKSSIFLSNKCCFDIFALKIVKYFYNVFTMYLLCLSLYLLFFLSAFIIRLCSTHFFFFRCIINKFFIFTFDTLCFISFREFPRYIVFLVEFGSYSFDANVTVIQGCLMNYKKSISIW